MAILAGRSAIAAPLEAYGKLPAIEDAALSPDGEHLAFIMTDGEKRRVTVFNTADMKIRANFNAGSMRVRSVEWAGSDHIIITTSSTTLVEGLEGWKREWFVPGDADIRTGRFRPLLANMDNIMNVSFGTPMVRMIGGKPHAFVQGMHFVNNMGYDSLFEFRFDSGLLTLLRDGRRGTEDWLVDDAGKPLAENVYDDDSKKWALLVQGRRGWRTVKSDTAVFEHPWIAGLGRDGRSALIGDAIDVKDGPTLQVLREMAPDADDWGPAFAAAEDHEPLIDSSTGVLIGVKTLVGEDDHYEFYDPRLQKYWNAIVKAYPGDHVLFNSVSDDRRKFLIYVDSPTEGPGYALVNIATGSSELLGGPYDDAAKDMAPVKSISFKAADGVALTGYLTTPKGAELKNLPLVVFPHGGPAVRDEPRFDWWAQAMASRGYAVLQVNFRGSGGFGWDFLSSGFGQVGRKMQTDLSDGVRHLAAEGVVDPKRVCIVGDSYGGYAALAGATLDTGVYRCAVAVSGMSDLKRMENWDRSEKGSGVQRYWLRYLGVNSLSDPKLAEISPIDHIDRVAVPVLLIHGVDDTVVPFEQSQIMYDALQKAGKPVELVKLKHEDHQLLVGDTRLQMLQETIAFLQKYNPPN